MIKHVHFSAWTLAVFFLAAWPAQAVDKEVVQRAIDQGINFLKANQLPDGSWPHEYIGATGLVGLTLLECGVPRADPAVQRAAQLVRRTSITLTHTYSLSLSILFLDLMGDPADEALIESMAVRLLAGQTAQGGWVYQCPGPNEVESRRLARLTEQRNQLVAGQELSRTDPEERRPAQKLSPEIQLQLQQVRFQRLQNLGARKGGSAAITPTPSLPLWLSGWPGATACR